MVVRYKIFSDGKATNFRCDDEELLKRYEELFEDISSKINKEFYSGPTYENDYGIHIKSKVSAKITYFMVIKNSKKIVIIGF